MAKATEKARSYQHELPRLGNTRGVQSAPPTNVVKERRVR